ncbi:MAG: two-component system, response regulator YesN [Clostridiales bacterium]|nr:two-component system, response regulator YesN [Clostridiales bacterium]
MKVFLVEDEFIVREGIKKNIDWIKEGIDFCGEASDGELAYPMIKSLKPDIMITDIRMPFMDGLELSRLIKKEMPDIKIIVLSGHEEFEYAKEAIKIGVEEYLLKPISGDELIEAVKKVAFRIEEERTEKENIEKFRMEMEENEEEAKRQFFNDLIRSSQPLGEILERGRQLSLDLTASYYNIILFKMQRLHGEKTALGEEYSKRLFLIRTRINEYLQGNKMILEFNRNIEGVAFLIKADQLEQLEERQKRLISTIEGIIKEYRDIKYFGGIGVTVNRLRELERSFEEASRAFAYRFLIEESCFLDSRKIKEEMADKGESFHLSVADAEKLDRNKVEYFLRCGEKEDVSFFVDEYLKNIGNDGKNSLLFRQYIVMDMHLTVKQFLEDLGVKVDVRKETFEEKKMLETVASIQNSISYLEHLLTRAIDSRNDVSRKKSGDIIDKTKTYIESNYMSEDLSLNSAASFVNVSPSHLSAVFSQEMGVTFVKYLTDYRMNKAKELLKCTNKRSNEISVEVGYRDPHYFSYLFKKTQGCTPLQFRGTKGGEE